MCKNVFVDESDSVDSNNNKTNKYMATRSLIAMEVIDANGVCSYSAVYCHYDGYPSGVGEKLFTHYTDPEKVKTLISFGDMSSLADTVEDTSFYYKRGDRIKIIKNLPTIENLKISADSIGCEYLYVFKDNGWVYYKI